MTTDTLPPLAALARRTAGIVLGALLCAQASAQSLDDRVRELERRVEQLEREIGRQLTAPTGSRTARAPLTMVDEYQRRITDKIRRFIVEPPNLQGNPEAEFAVTLSPGGEVAGVKILKPSGNAAWDAAAERAIQKAQPLPLPPDPAMFKDFRELRLKFSPQPR